MSNQSAKDPASRAVIDEASDIIILMGNNPSQDTVAGALGLFHALLTLKKNVSIGTPAKLSQTPPLPSADQITNKLGNRNLVISLKVDSRESIDKVSYNLDESGKTFNLVIQPKKGHPPLKSKDIEYSYAGVQADLVFIIGTNRLEDLGHFYKDEQKLFTEATTIAINRTELTKYAQYHFSHSQSSSMAEIVYQYATERELSLSGDAATCLLYGIDAATNALQQPNINPSTFETVAQLLRSGAKRTPVNPTAASMPPLSQTPPPFRPPTNDVPQEWLAPKIYSGSGPTRQ